MNRNRAFVPITLLSFTAVLCSAAASRAQSDFAGTWALTPDEAAVGNVRFCVLGSSVVVHGSGEVSPAGTVTYASGSVDANGVLALTIRATNSQTNLRSTRVFAGNLSLTGTSSGIGAKMTEVLSQNGFFVYAGARAEADLERLDAMENDGQF